MPNLLLAERTRRTIKLDTGTREVSLPVDSMGRERWRAELDERSIERRANGTTADFRGHAAVFDIRTWIGPKRWGFWEQVGSGAFDKTIKEADVRFLINHNPDLLMARNASGTLDLATDKVGLRSDATVDTRQSYTNDVVIALDRGDISQMSFAFETIKDSWETLGDGTELRTLLEVKLWDVSVVTYPAYEETDAALRGAAFDMLCSAAGLEERGRERLLRALTTDEDDPELTPVVRAAVEALARADRPSEPGPPTRVEPTSQPAPATGGNSAVLRRRMQLSAQRLGIDA
jgi:uncharacterized protein